MLPGATSGRGSRGPASSSGGRRGIFIGCTELAVFSLLLLVVLGVGYHAIRLRGRIAALSGAGELSSRHQLLSQIHAWNDQARASGMVDQLIQVDPSSHAAGSAVATAGGSACACADPPDKKWPMQSASTVEKENPDLVTALKKHAKNNEIMLALANGIMICKNTTICWWNGGNILESFLEIIDHNKITNHLIGVMDDETEAYLKGRPYNYFRVNIVIPASQAKSHPANRVSTIKYTLLKQIIQLGYNALITDMDLVYLKNPFNHLHRDADVEIQTDGFDETSYGVTDSINDPSMGWGGGGLFIRLFTTNVGCMWVKSNARSYTLMSQVADHLQSNAGWDQQVFNQYLLQPSHGSFANSGVSLRIMDYMQWVNSKIFFKSQRNAFIPGATATAEEPIMVHFNYHPDKHVRMLCIMDRYMKGNVSACDHLPPGSKPV